MYKIIIYSYYYYFISLYIYIIIKFIIITPRISRLSISPYTNNVV